MEAGIYCPESLKPAILFFKQIAITNMETEIYEACNFKKFLN